MLLRLSLLCGLLLTGGASSFLWGLNAMVPVSESVQAAEPKADQATPLDAESQTEARSDDDEESQRRKPLPTYYGMIGVSDQQRDQLAKVQDEYEEKLEKLREELKRLVDERDQKMEVMLTPGQKLRLSELREAARIRAQQKPLTPPVDGK